MARSIQGGLKATCLSFWPNLCSKASPLDLASICAVCEFVKSHVSKRQQTSAIVNIRCDAIRRQWYRSQHTSAYVSIRQHTSSSSIKTILCVCVCVVCVFVCLCLCVCVFVCVVRAPVPYGLTLWMKDGGVGVTQGSG
jgi:hypothetical protein